MKLSIILTIGAFGVLAGCVAPTGDETPPPVTAVSSAVESGPCPYADKAYKVTFADAKLGFQFDADCSKVLMVGKPPKWLPLTEKANGWHMTDGAGRVRFSKEGKSASLSYQGHAITAPLVQIPRFQ